MAPRRSTKRRSSTKTCKRSSKYKSVPSTKFCGPSGGACPNSYPVNTRKRAHAALAYAHYAPDPEGIRRCVYRKMKSMRK